MGKVKCDACDKVSSKSEWEKAEVKDNKFVGGCPFCKGEFYTEVDK